ncbi:WXG100 family type VII secretion target [Paenibacillus shunpengii]|uniref:WXG100 family type VII secretion target n=1 Tax=Paenibacillus shunpengii TaxID=2054424 RepID=A0ABW5SHM1_9BACL
MTRIKVPIDVLLSVSDQFDNASNQLKMINENLLRQIFMLMSNWYGQRGTAFQTDFKTAYEQMNVTIERMHVISQELKGIAVRFMDADQLQDFMGEQRMELFAKLSTTNHISEPPKSFIDQVGDTAKDLAGGLKKGLGSVVESLKDTGAAIVKNPIGTLGDMAYNATVGTAEDVIGFAAWGKNMVMDEGEREAFLKEIQMKANESGKANFVGEQAGVMLGSFLVSRIGIKGGPNHKADTGGDGGSSKNSAVGKGDTASNFISGKGIYTQYSGGLKQANKEDVNADLLAKKIGGQSRMIFNNDPKGREFDVISEQYIGQTKTSMNSLSSQFREQAKATIEASIETGGKAYFHFETAPADKVIRQLKEYEKRYNVEIVIDISSLK